jgi:hypothetical protein
MPTYSVIVDLGIPPSFNVETSGFAEMVGAKKIQEFSLTAGQATLCLGRCQAGRRMELRVHLEAEVPGPY